MDQIHCEVLAHNAVHIKHRSATGDFPADRPWYAHVFTEAVAQPHEALEFQVETQHNGVQLRDAAGEVFFRELHSPQEGRSGSRNSLDLDVPKVELSYRRDKIENGVRLTLECRPGEGFYGWGEWFNAFRRERGTLHLQIRDALAMIQHRNTYSALPFFLSTRGYGFILLNSHASHWSIDPEAGKLTIEADGPGSDYIVIRGPHFKDIIATYTALCGRPPLLPKWAFGLFLTSYPQQHQAEVLSYLRQHRQRELPLDAVILDYHWEQKWHNFRWREQLFPDPEAFIDELNALNYKLGLIITPFINHRRRPFQRFVLNRLASNIPPGLENADERAPEEYAQASAAGYFAHPNAKWWFGAGGMLDFTNPDAANWWQHHLDPLYDQGVAFFKNDDGEYLPADAHSHSGMDGREYHNLYGFFYLRAIFEGMATRGNTRPFIYARSAWLGAQRYPALFLGDQKPTFEHIKSTMRAGLTLGLLGFAYWTADVFGLDGETTPETHMRYAQWALLVPVARYFTRPESVDKTRFPWAHGPAGEENFRFYTNLRYRLLPYYYTLAREAYESGLPLLRPLLLEFQDDPRLEDLYDQVMLGPALMIAPVVEENARERDIVLPAGRWYDFWSAQSYAGGGSIHYPAPLERLPLLVRGGSILPLGPQMSHIPPQHTFAQLTLHCYPPYPTSCVLYDDDGRTTDYQNDAFVKTQVSVSQDQQAIVIQIQPFEGALAAVKTPRSFELILHACDAPQALSCSHETGFTWNHDPAARKLTCNLTAPLCDHVVLRVKLKAG